METRFKDFADPSSVLFTVQLENQRREQELDGAYRDHQQGKRPNYYQELNRVVNLSLIGYGTVGKNFIEILAAKQQMLEERYHCSFNVTEIYEIDGAVINPNGVDIATLAQTQAIRDSTDWQQDVKAVQHIPDASGHIIIEVTPTNRNLANRRFPTL